jgi:hypothetical protein
MNTKAMNQVVDLTPHMDTPHYATRGAVYKALRSLGQSDFIAASFAFNSRQSGPAVAADATLSVEQVVLYFTDGPHALAA